MSEQTETIEAPKLEAQPSKHKRLWLYGPWALFIVLAAAWCVYWFTLADQVEKRLHQWAAAHEQAGGRAQIGAITRHGFPAMMRFDLDNFAYGPANGAFQIETPRVTLHVNLMDPRHLYIERKARFTLIQGIDRSDLDADSAMLSLQVKEHGFSYAGLEAYRVKIDNPRTEGFLTLGHIVANARPDPRNAEDWQIALLMDELHLARPIESFEGLGQDMQHVQAAVVWTAAQHARIEASETRWGLAQADVTGEIGFDDAHRIAGQLHVSAPRDALQYMPEAVQQSVAARQPAQNPMQFTLDAQDGVMSVDGRAVRPLRALYY